MIFFNFQKYEKYKKRYIMLKGGKKYVEKDQLFATRKGIKRDVVLLVGSSASGKSTVAEWFEEKGWHLIRLDDIVRNQIMPLFKKEIDKEFNGTEWHMFKLYRDKDYGKTINKAKKIFGKIVRNEIEKAINHNKKVVVEGVISDYELIRDIFGKDDEFILYLIEPA